jgi:hypothetical protein
MITEENLINLGFERINQTPELSGSDYDWYYYVLDIGKFALISNANDEATNNSWGVNLFDYDYVITNMNDLTDLINVLRRIIK